MFKGSSKYTWEDVNRIFDEIGARYNAFTSQEMTAYYANVLPEFTEKAIEHLSHLLRPAIRDEDFDTEKKVILEEIAMYLDDPGHRLYEKLMEAHFGNHPLRMSVLGSAESIQKLERDQMADYFTQPLRAGQHGAVRDGPAGFRRDRAAGGEVHAATGRTWTRRASSREPMYKPQRDRDDRREAQPPVHDGHDARPQRAGRPPLRRPRAGRRHRRLRRLAASTGRWSTTRSPRTPTSASIPTTPAAASTSPSPPTPSAPTRRWTSRWRNWRRSRPT